MDYLPTLGETWTHSRGNVGRYSRHGAFGIGKHTSPMDLFGCPRKLVKG